MLLIQFASTSRGTGDVWLNPDDVTAVVESTQLMASGHVAPSAVISMKSRAQVEVYGNARKIAERIVAAANGQLDDGLPAHMSAPPNA